MRLWLGRTWIGVKHNAYELGIAKKGWQGEKYGFNGEYNLISFCTKDFERITGIKLKHGELVKVKITKLPKGKGFVFEVEK